MKLIGILLLVHLLLAQSVLSQESLEVQESAAAAADSVTDDVTDDITDDVTDDITDDVTDDVKASDDDADDEPDESGLTVEEILAGGGKDAAGHSDYILHQVERINFPDTDEEEEEVDGDDDDDDDDVIKADSDDYTDDDVQDDDDDDDEEKEAEEEYPDAPYKRNKKWKDGWDQYPLYVIIIGGFRWDFLGDRYTNLTSFAYLMQHGTTVKRVKPVFPPEDFPVWTSISTGSYPGDHDITGDVMFNLKTRSYFNRSDDTSRRQEDWWKSMEPFWSTAAKHGRKVAFFNWHDCQLPGKALEKPSDCVPYNARSAPSRQFTAAQFDAAFTKIHRDHYDLSVVYTDIVKKAAQRYGPNSPQLYKAMKYVDDILQEKLYDIRNKKDIKDKLNVMVMSDYGLADVNSMEEVVIEDFLDLDDTQSIVYSSGYAAITPFALGHNKILLDSGKMPGVDAFLTSQVQNPRIWHGVRIPENLHFGDGEWTTDVLLVARPGYRLSSRLTDEPKIISVNGYPDSVLSGGAGYNPHPVEVAYPKIEKGQKLTQEINDTLKAYDEYHKYKYDMHTQAFLIGPDFKVEHEVEDEIEVVDFYQIICFLLNIPARSSHAGSWDRIQDMLTVSGATGSAEPHFIITAAATIMTLLLHLMA